MYLASLYIYFDLDPSMVPVDKDRLLLSVREKLKQKFRNKFTSQIDEVENSLALAFFNHSYDKSKAYLREILDALETMSEARLSSHTEQILTWFDGHFVDAHQKNLFDMPGKKKTDSCPRPSNNESAEKTIVYTDSDEDDVRPISSRFDRRNLRLPTRK